MWTLLTIACGVGLAARLPDGRPPDPRRHYASAFAGGAVLMMLADSMIPESYRHGGRLVGLLTVIGFLVAGVLTVLQ